MVGWDGGATDVRSNHSQPDLGLISPGTVSSLPEQKPGPGVLGTVEGNGREAGKGWPTSE